MRKYLIIIFAVFATVGMVINGCNCKNTKTGPTPPVAPTATTFIPCAASPTTIPTANGLLVSGYETSTNTNALGGYWFAINDCVDGGSSVVWPIAGSMGGTFVMSSPGPGGCGYAAHITGTVGTGYKYAFIAMGTQTNAAAGVSCTGVDWSMWTGISFWEKVGPANTWPQYSIIIANTGDGAANAIACPTPGTPNNTGAPWNSGAVNPPTCSDNSGACSCLSNTYNNDPWVILPMPTTWSQIQVPFANFTTQGAWGNNIPLLGPSTDVPKHGIYDVKQIAWQSSGNSGGQSGNVDFWVDDIIVYK